MTSPAARYSRFRARQQSPRLVEFADEYGFPLDDYQLEACQALERGAGALVAAPTGAGKTVVGEFAVRLALDQGSKCFYTTPVKALSNQKYADLARRHGSARVGLLTGDNTVNGDAPVVVMTTEVLRNMLYAGSPTLAGLGYVVMDEVHYLADRFRGAVWEEVIIHLPESVTLASLSATVSNAEEFGEWLGTVRGATAVVVEERRPVPLYQHVLVGRRLLDLFTAAGDDDPPEVNPYLLRATREWQRWRPSGHGHRRGAARGRQPYGRTASSPRTPTRSEVVQQLSAAGLLPAIVFVFSRAGCDAASRHCLDAGLRLTTPAEQADIDEVVDRRCADLPPEDLVTLGFHQWVAGLRRGIAAHHAGLLPTFKECVEELFGRGLVKVVFATETLALGVNMPARSVVIERLVKWNGESHVDVTPGEYTQLTGRAGRRGIDVEGHAVVLFQPGLDPRAVAGLASTRTYPLRSSFRPSYNMAVNLVQQVGRATARELLESSFAQFQADRAVVDIARQVHRNTEALTGYREAIACDRGDFLAYADLRRRLAGREKQLARQRRADRRAEVVRSLEGLRVGDVVEVPAGRWAGPAVVVDPGVRSSRDGPRPLVVTASRQARRLSVVDFPTSVQALTRLRVPRAFNARNPQQRRDLASALRTRLSAAPTPARPDPAVDEADEVNGQRSDGADLAGLQAEIRAHPCHRCPDRASHERWAERWFDLSRRTEALQRSVEQRTNTIARQFDRVCEVLDDLGYLAGDQTTPAGARLARVYTELDLVVAECLRQELWVGLRPAELAAVVSALVFESRTPDDAEPPRLPPGQTRTALAEVVRVWGRLQAVERQHRLDFLREPDPGFAWAAYQWASGARLDAVLSESGMAAGDFVRWVRQVLDLADQVAEAAGDGPVRTTARTLSASMRRGVVSLTSVPG